MRQYNSTSVMTAVTCDTCGKLVYIAGDQTKPADTDVSPGWYRCGTALDPTDACCDVHAYKQGGPRAGSVVSTKQLVTLEQ